jgi:hypothetical protein
MCRSSREDVHEATAEQPRYDPHVVAAREKPQVLRCSSQRSGPFPNISASLSPFGWRPVEDRFYDPALDR